VHAQSWTPTIVGTTSEKRWGLRPAMTLVFRHARTWSANLQPHTRLYTRRLSRQTGTPGSGL